MPRPPRSPRASFLAAAAAFTVATAAVALQVDRDAFIPVRTAEQYASDAAVAPIVSVDNAALLYYRYFELLDDDLIDAVKTFAADNGGWDDHTWTPDDELSARLAEADAVRGFLRATTIDHADFGVEVELGVWATLTHLAPMRATARVVAADARRLHAAGDVEAAAERIAALHQAARHTSQDATAISSLVGATITNLACAETERLVESGDLTANALETLRDAIDAYDTTDPLNTRRAVEFERDIFFHWIRTAYDNASGEELVEGFGSFAGPVADPDLAKMSPAEVNAEMDKTLDYYAAALQVWDKDDAVARLNELDTLTDSGGFGAVARVIAPSLGRLRQGQFDAAERIADTKDALRTAATTQPATIDAAEPLEKRTP